MLGLLLLLLMMSMMINSFIVLNEAKSLLFPLLRQKYKVNILFNKFVFQREFIFKTNIGVSYKSSYFKLTFYVCRNYLFLFPPKM
jgi:hypothetical protein